jgi:UDP-GlcNAc:undecaprenyl-phosphate/decaprenyl-phosphate GlcNAc-1-phosphate transferase
VRAGRLTVENYRGVPVPRTLGLVLVLAAVGSTGVIALTRRPAPVARAGWGALAATVLVFVAGLVDDLAPAGPRGLRNHVRGLAAGHVSTGVVKVVVIVAAAVVAIALQPGRSGWIRLAGAVLVAASANVWNGLDVRPGRAIKFGLVASLGLVGVDLILLPTLPGVVLGSAAGLWFDLHERAMLGDGGANLLGFTVGLGLYQVLPDRGVVVAAVVAVAINAVAETTTLSRVIDVFPPLRWFDGLGRLPT